MIKENQMKHNFEQRYANNDFSADPYDQYNTARKSLDKTVQEKTNKKKQKTANNNTKPVKKINQQSTLENFEKEYQQFITKLKIELEKKQIKADIKTKSKEPVKQNVKEETNKEPTVPTIEINVVPAKQEKTNNSVWTKI